MMKVFYSPIVGLPHTMSYSFEGETMRAEYNGEFDEFNFAGLPDGQLIGSEVETSLIINPIMDIKKIDGVLYLTLLNPIAEDATEAEKFPEWVEV